MTVDCKNLLEYRKPGLQTAYSFKIKKFKMCEPTSKPNLDSCLQLYNKKKDTVKYILTPHTD